MKFYFLLFLLSFSSAVFTQNGLFKKTFVTAEARVGHTFEGLVGNTVFFPPDKYEVIESELPKSSTMYSLRLIGGGYIHPKISLGLGAGIEGNSGYIYTTSPFFIDARFHFGEMNDSGRIDGLYIYTDYGVLFKWNSHFEKGQMFEIGFGGELNATTFSLGYNFRRLKDNWVGDMDVHSLTISLGYVF